ncbi:DNA polymerase I [bacterium]|nr:DNA polymerase I [bacterium]
MTKIYIIDGSSLVYRSFHAIRDLKTSYGQPTNAIYGFTVTLIKLLKEIKTDHIVFAFDVKGPTIRHKTFSEYKANRKPMPDELSVQVPIIKKILNLFGISIFEQQGYEGDDIIASLVKRIKSESNRIYIVTGDKDMLQLLEQDIFIVNPGDGSIMDKEKFKVEYGVEPNNVVDIIGLAGDKSDNIPGLVGLGEKTALKLIKEFGGVKEIFANIDNVSPERLRLKLKEGEDTVYMGMQLGKLVDDIVLDVSLKDIKMATPDTSGILELFETLEFRNLSKSLKGLDFINEESYICEDMVGLSTGEVVAYETIVSNVERFKEICESEEIEKCGFNIKEKIIELKKKGIDFKMPFFDFIIAKHLTGKEIFEKDIFSCRRKYEKVLEDLKLKKLFDEVETPLVKTLAWMQSNGIKIDVDFLQLYSIDLQKEIDILQDKIFLLAGEIFNLNSPQQLATILFQKLGMPPGRKTKTSFSTDNSVLKELSNDYPIANMVLQYRETYKLNSTYIKGLIPHISKETGRIHPDFSQISTSTGRLSCSNPNLQNLPIKTEKGSEIRRAFTAEGNNVLYSFDYSQIELRILAHFSEDKYLIDAFNKDRDIHQEVSDALFSGESLFSVPIPEGIKDFRRVAKTINFGIIYGMSSFGLAQELNISVPEADTFIKEYFNRFPNVKDYINKTVQFVEKNGYVSTILNRRRYISEVQSQDKRQREFGRRAAVNMPIQGSAADLIKVAMNNIYNYFHTNNLKSRMVLQVHDELLFEVVADEEKEVYENVKKLMEEVMVLKVPLKTDVKKGYNYQDMVPIK